MTRAMNFFPLSIITVIVGLLYCFLNLIFVSLSLYTATFNVALKALNKAVKKDTIATTDIDTDYSKPRNRKPSKRLLSSDSDEEPREKKTLKSQNIPGPSLTLPSKLATLFDNIKAKNVTTPKQQKSVSSKVLSIPSKKDTTSISQLFESAQSGLYF